MTETTKMKHPVEVNPGKRLEDGFSKGCWICECKDGKHGTTAGKEFSKISEK